MSQIVPEPETGPANPTTGPLPTKAPPGWLPFVLPLAVFLVGNSLEGRLLEAWGDSYYPHVYTLKLLLVLGALAYAWPAFREFRFCVSVWALGAGMVGAGVWIGLAEAQSWFVAQPFLPESVATLLGANSRIGFNPWEQLPNNTASIAWFFSVRFFGLVMLVPIIEELFLRGFLVRFMEDQDWWRVPVGQAGTVALLSATVYGMASHPGELLAAAAWFTLISLLALRTRSLYDCILAHAVTNLILGFYVLAASRWELW